MSGQRDKSKEREQRAIKKNDSSNRALSCKKGGCYEGLRVEKVPGEAGPSPSPLPKTTTITTDGGGYGCAATSRGKKKWWVMLDAAKFVGTGALDLSKIEADFVALSFYKMFG